MDDYILVAVTSQVVTTAGAVPLGRAEVIDGALPKDSIVRLGKIFTLHSSLIVKRICRLTPAKKTVLIRQLQEFLAG